MKISTPICIGLSILLGACATTGPHEGQHRGSVVMKTSDSEGHVCLGNKQVKNGDLVEVIRHECVRKRVSRDGSQETCVAKKIGQGKVTKVYSLDYSVVAFEPGVDFKEGDSVEVKK